MVAADFPSRRRWLVVLLACGLAWRVTRYLLTFPFWGDEAFVCLSLPGRGFWDLTGPLAHAQVAPLLFMWGELAAYRLLGAGEGALRLLPFLAGVGGLGLFGLFARLTLAPAARPLAVGFLAVAVWPVSMGTLVKPYAFDLFFSLALLVPAVLWLRAPHRIGWLTLLAAVAPVALLGSYPAVFVAGGVALALLPAVVRRRSALTWAAYIAFGGLTLAGFVVGDLVVGSAQLDPARGYVGAYLRDYWAHGFPPRSPGAFALWFVRIHTGLLMAYPVGAPDGGSAVTTLLVVAGVAVFARQRRWALLTLGLAPFALGLVAAGLGRYPYGGCCRLSQHVAPFVCLAAGAGTADLIGRARTAAARRRWATAACAVLAGVGVIGLGRDVIRPYRTAADVWSRDVIRRLADDAGPDGRVLVLNTRAEVKPLFDWLLHQYAPDAVCLDNLERFPGGCSGPDKPDAPAKGGPIPSLARQACGPRHAAPGTALADAPPPGGRVCAVYVAPVVLADGSALPADPPAAVRLAWFEAALNRGPRRWTRTAHIPSAPAVDDPNAPVERCDLYQWTAAGPPALPGAGPPPYNGSDAPDPTPDATSCAPPSPSPRRWPPPPPGPATSASSSPTTRRGR